jgi:hypothetical protein
MLLLETFLLETFFFGLSIVTMTIEIKKSLIGGKSLPTYKFTLHKDKGLMDQGNVMDEK